MSSATQSREAACPATSPKADEPESNRDRNTTLPGWWLFGGALACLTAAGLLLWSRDGAAVFGDYIMAGLAWCF